MLTYAVLFAIAASGWIGMAIVMVLGHLDEDKAASAIAVLLTRAEKAELERDASARLWLDYHEALRAGMFEVVLAGWSDEMRRRSARLAEIEPSVAGYTRALELIADGCSRPSKVAAAALGAERARREDEEAMTWVQ